MIQILEERTYLPIQLQFRSKIPLSDQVRRAIFAMIERGGLQEGDPLPTVRDLAEQLGVNFNTIARAYRALDREGWVMTRQGRGTVVTKPVREEVVDPFAAKVQELVEAVQGAAEENGLAPLEILQLIQKRLESSLKQRMQPAKTQNKQKTRRFRSYQAAIPRSRITRKEKPDLRLRKLSH